MSWTEFLDEYQDPLQEATWVTVKLAFSSFGLALLVGVIVVSFRVSPIPPLVRAASWFVAAFRNTPLLVVLFLALFGLSYVGVYWRIGLRANRTR